MNVNPSSEQFGEIKPWDSLTDEEKASGDWIELPDVSGSPPRQMARKKSRIEKLFGAAKSGKIEDIEDFMRDRVRGQFDALGKPR